ncbi:MAG: response regulator, partial [Lachnospiraceae bacterium]|nr:response regulator [Lachnospiraceae bacterium]
KNMIKVMEYIHDMNSDNRKTICLIGESIGLRIAKENLGELKVREEYVRPIDIRQIVADMHEFAQDHFKLSQLKTVLLVDDDTDFLKLMQNWLRDSYWVDVVNSGDQAIEYLADNRPDLILLDYDMPKMSGTEVMKHIKDRPMTASIPIIFLTGISDQEVVMEIIKEKPSGYILKSSTRDEVLDKLDQFFTKHILLRKRGLS